MAILRVQISVLSHAARRMVNLIAIASSGGLSVVPQTLAPKCRGDHDVKTGHVPAAWG